MDIEKFLYKSVKKQFESTQTVNGLSEKISRMAANRAEDLAKERHLIVDGRRFDFVGVYSSFSPYNLNIGPVKIIVQYILSEPKTKIERERIAHARAYLSENKRLPWKDYKNPLWREIRFSVTVNEVVKGNFYLNIQ